MNTTLRTYGLDTPQRDVAKQDNHSDLHYVPDQGQGDTYIRFYEIFTITNWDIHLHHACVHSLVCTFFKQDNLALTTFLGCFVLSIVPYKK